MANYNPFPAVYNPYPVYPNNSYQQQYSQAAQAQYQQPGTNYAQPQQNMIGMVWVDGEIGAKAYQLPQGWPANAPMPLWDTNDTVIYLKSVNNMGMPNPLQKVRYTMEEPPRAAPQIGNQSTLPTPEGGLRQTSADLSDYVRRDELTQMKDEIKAAISAVQSEAKGAKNNGKSSV